MSRAFAFEWNSTIAAPSYSNQLADSFELIGAKVCRASENRRTPFGLIIGFSSPELVSVLKIEFELV